MFTAANLHNTLAHLGIQQPGDIFDQLAIAYSEPWRHYHTQTHISHCLTLAHTHRAIAIYPDEVNVALWFHDAIYNPHRHDNEEKSAQWAQHYLHSVSIDSTVIDRIVAMILATKTHQTSTPDAMLLLDIDLSILGTSPQEFEIYDQAIRQEYAWVPEVDYEQARQRILQSFLKRSPLYHTLPFQQQYETQARQNLTHRKRPQQHSGTT